MQMKADSRGAQLEHPQISRPDGSKFGGRHMFELTKHVEVKVELYSVEVTQAVKDWAIKHTGIPVGNHCTAEYSRFTKLGATPEYCYLTTAVGRTELRSEQIEQAVREAAAKRVGVTVSTEDPISFIWVGDPGRISKVLVSVAVAVTDAPPTAPLNCSDGG